MRRRLRSRVRRGRVEIGVSIEHPGGSQPGSVLNRALLTEVLASASVVEREHGLEGTPDVMGVLSIPGMFKTDTTEIEWSVHVDPAPLIVAVPIDRSSSPRTPNEFDSRPPSLIMSVP